MLIGLTGYAQHGKDTVANILVDVYGYTKLSFAEPLRQLALRLNPYVLKDWPGIAWRYSDLLEHAGYELAKTEWPEVRRILQELGTGVRDILGEDVWVQAAEKAMLSVPGKVVFTDVRVPNEAAFIRRHSGELWRVQRTDWDGSPFDNGVGTTHPSERYISTLPHTRGILAANVEQLEEAVHSIMMEGMEVVCEP